VPANKEKEKGRGQTEEKGKGGTDRRPPGEGEGWRGKGEDGCDCNKRTYGIFVSVGRSK
jgi:hypothetical protein